MYLDDTFKNYKGGVLEEKPSMLLYDYNIVCGNNTESVPESFMLSKERIPDCRNQKTTGQCAAFSSTNILQILNEIETGKRIQFSTTYVYGRHRDEGTRNMEGMYVSNLMKRMCVKGSVPHELLNVLYEVPEAYDYVNGLDNIEELDRIAETYKIHTYVAFKSGDKEKKILDVKKALLKHQIPILGVFPMCGANHAVAIVGWDKTCFYFMNSWGDNGGKHDGIDYAKSVRLKEAFLMLDQKNVVDFPFNDVANEHWGYNAIKHCYNSGIINGVDEHNFMPDSKLTRAQIAQVVYKLAQKYADFNATSFQDATVECNFVDLNKTHWAYKAARYCNSKKIINSDMKFKPDEELTREEFCDIIYNFIVKHCTSAMVKSINEKITKNCPFIDINNSTYVNSILFCYSIELINGIEATKFMPKEHLTRAQLCQIIYKLVKVIEKYEA